MMVQLLYFPYLTVHLGPGNTSAQPASLVVFRCTEYHALAIPTPSLLWSLCNCTRPPNLQKSSRLRCRLWVQQVVLMRGLILSNGSGGDHLENNYLCISVLTNKINGDPFSLLITKQGTTSKRSGNGGAGLARQNAKVK